MVDGNMPIRYDFSAHFNEMYLLRKGEGPDMYLILVNVREKDSQYKLLH